MKVSRSRACTCKKSGRKLEVRKDGNMLKVTKLTLLVLLGLKNCQGRDRAFLLLRGNGRENAKAFSNSFLLLLSETR
jgi:hypothetical protein